METITENKIDEKARQLANQNVYACASTLMYELARPHYLWKEHGGQSMSAIDLLSRAEPELESAYCVYRQGEDDDDEPEEIDVYEHWIISDWLRVKLIEYDEKVIEAFGWYIWCRTTTGQAIYCDGVFQKIARELLKEYGR